MSKLPRTPQKPSRQPLFALGQVVATPGALELMRITETSPLVLIAKHVSGDWGECDPEDVQTNNDAVTEGFRILSVYRLPLKEPSKPKSTAADAPPVEDDRIWVITEADRSVTTFLLPEEY